MNLALLVKKSIWGEEKPSLLNMWLTQGLMLHCVEKSPELPLTEAWRAQPLEELNPEPRNLKPVVKVNDTWLLCSPLYCQITLQTPL